MHFMNKPTGKNADQLLKEATKLTPDAAIKKITVTVKLSVIKDVIKKLFNYGK